jgi:peptide/nickel transport system permease protein
VNATMTQAERERVFEREHRKRVFVVEWLRILWRHRPAFIGFIALIILAFIALTAPILAPADPTAISGRDRLTPAFTTSEFPLGTDFLGRDILSRLVYGARISLGVGATVVIAANIVGISVGLAAGYYRRLDNVLMRVMDALMAFPPVLLALGIMAALGAALMNTIVALSIVYTPLIARVTRSTVLVVRDIDYVMAARAIGMGNRRIMFRHVLPNCIGPVIVQATFIFAYAVILEAALSFLGVGTPPETPSWGNMLDDARQHMRRLPSLAILPGAAIMITVLSLNLLGDGLRDILDPHSYSR